MVTIAVASVRAQGVLPGLLLAGGAAVVAFGLHRLVPGVPAVVTALVLGLFLANTRGVSQRALPGLALASGAGLKLGVVLLGFELVFQDVFSLGGRGLLVVVVVVLVTFAGTQLAGPRLGISKGLSLLVATGFSICGVSAIAAAKDASAADEEEVTYAIALVTLCGSLAIVTLPALRGFLGLDDHAYGMWVGASVHDVAQVVATASAVGGVAVTTAIVVKLTRVLLLGPLVWWIAWREGRHVDTPAYRFVPPFILAFVAAALLRSTDLVPDSLLSLLADAKSLLLTMALFAVGSRVDVRRLLAIGLRPLALGLCSWAIVAGVAYAGVRVVSG